MALKFQAPFPDMDLSPELIPSMGFIAENYWNLSFLKCCCVRAQGYIRPFLDEGSLASSITGRR